MRDMLSATGQYEINVVRGGQPVYSYILSAECSAAPAFSMGVA